jgi:hypothetical protein
MQTVPMSPVTVIPEQQPVSVALVEGAKLSLLGTIEGSSTLHELAMVAHARS